MKFSTLLALAPLAALQASAGPLAPRATSSGASASAARSSSGGGSQKAQIVGSTTSDVYPPPSATNTDTASFIPESVLGYAGPTPTGAEPEVVATGLSQPQLTNYFPLVEPTTEDGNSSFNPILYWGNLSPMRSLPKGRFGINSGPELPSGYWIEQVHLLNRHGARYSTLDGALGTFAGKLHNATKNGTFSASGSLSFLNTWTYKLGGEILTPFGRLQLFEQGVRFREQYGSLLNNFTKSNALPVFQSTTQDRMYKSALNWMAGFFGLPYESQGHLQLTLEGTGFNNSLAPYFVCNNSNNAIGTIGTPIAGNWSAQYLADAHSRLAPLIKGYNLTVGDVYTMQQLCSYETVSLGYSKFCSLFTSEEFLDYSYSYALGFWYSNSYGNPTSAALGLGYLQNLLARLTHEHTPSYNSSLNSTLSSSDLLNPLNQSIYADFSHDTAISAIQVALNLTAPGRSGPLPTKRRPANQTFFVEEVAPFATELVTQVLGSKNGSYIRFLLNDAVVPLTSFKGCDENEYGLCPLSTYISSLRERIGEIDFDYACNGNYTYSVPSGGGGITNGQPPRRSSSSS